MYDLEIRHMTARLEAQIRARHAARVADYTGPTPPPPHGRAATAPAPRARDRRGQDANSPGWVRRSLAARWRAVTRTPARA